MAEATTAKMKMDRPRIALDIHGTVVRNGKVSETALDILEDLRDDYMIVIFTGETDIPEEVWNVLKTGECRKPAIEDYFTENREWKMNKNRVWKFDAIIDSDIQTLKNIDIPVGMYFQSEADWEGVRTFLEEASSRDVEPGLYVMEHFRDTTEKEAEI